MRSIRWIKLTRIDGGYASKDGRFSVVREFYRGYRGALLSTWIINDNQHKISDRRHNSLEWATHAIWKQLENEKVV